MTPFETAELMLVWLIYFLIHSLSASLRFKAWISHTLPALVPYYRLLFNGLACLLLLPPLYLTWLLRGDYLLSWQPPWSYLAYGISVAAGLLFLWSLRFYDLGEFSGFKQLKSHASACHDQSLLKISPLHRYVRHPWYSLGLAIVWSQSMDAAMLVSALCITLYLWVGSHLEEQKLLQYHGEVYAQYCKRVPGLIPLPWRWLDRDSAQEIEQRVRSATSSLNAQ
jgi:protein-S-isoprenylcysteine O-methyltransferase Ste14